MVDADWLSSYIHMYTTQSRGVIIIITLKPSSNKMSLFLNSRIKSNLLLFLNSNIYQKLGIHTNYKCAYFFFTLIYFCPQKDINLRGVHFKTKLFHFLHYTKIAINKYA